MYTKRQAAQKGDIPSGHSLPGKRGEIVVVPKLIEGLSFDALLADKAFDTDHLRHRLREKRAEAVIPANETI